MGHCRLGDTTTGYHFPSYVHQAVEESSCRHDNGFGTQLHAPDGLHSYHLLRLLLCHRNRLHQQLISLVLPDIEVVGMVQDTTPFPDKLPTVTLGTRAPHGRSFTAVKHSELDGCGIRHETHLSSKSVNLPHNLSFGNTTYGRVARHLRDLVHIHRYQTGLCSHVCRGTSSFAASMTTSDNQYVIIHYHADKGSANRTKMQIYLQFFLFFTQGRTG